MPLTVTIQQVECATTISEVANIIKQHFDVPVYAKVYLSPMTQLINGTSLYGVESGKEIVLRFLVNAQTLRGPLARACKKRLKELIR